MENLAQIVNKLPYGNGFHFVEVLTAVDQETCEGNYTFPASADYFESHFPKNPVVPGVLLIECMAQIGLVCFGIFLKGDSLTEHAQIAFTESEVQFFKPVFPDQKIYIFSKKIYWRLGKLKCEVLAKNEAGELVAKGILAGIIK